ncbi:hypothetical protein AB0N05_32860 [Nocardia sp. NPDC051030]|uniref:hypothetical protein n=1 Tax=Nocardia sp. NPDC051030 TaxID=3155162 RepID=UPI00342F8666
MTSAQQLLAEILRRYGTVDAFCAQLRRTLTDPEDPTPELPPTVAACTDFSSPWPEPTPGGRHRRPESD